MSNNTNSAKEKRALNVFDVLIPIIIIACIVGVFMRSCGNDDGGVEQSKVSVYFTATDVTDDVIASISENTSVYTVIDDESVLIGTIDDNNIENTEEIFRISNKTESVIGADGESVEVSYPDGTLYTVKGKLTSSGFYDGNHGFILSDECYLTPGQKLVVYTENAVLNVVINEIVP